MADDKQEQPIAEVETGEPKDQSGVETQDIRAKLALFQAEYNKYAENQHGTFDPEEYKLMLENRNIPFKEMANSDGVPDADYKPFNMMVDVPIADFNQIPEEDRAAAIESLTTALQQENKLAPGKSLIIEHNKFVGLSQGEAHKSYEDVREDYISILTGLSIPFSVAEDKTVRLTTPNDETFIKLRTRLKEINEGMEKNRNNPARQEQTPIPGGPATAEPVQSDKNAEHVNHIAEASKFKAAHATGGHAKDPNYAKALNAADLNKYAATIPGGMDTIIKDIAGPDGQLTDANIEQYLNDSQNKNATDVNHRLVGGMDKAVTHLRAALVANASPEMRENIKHGRPVAAPDQYAHKDAPKPERTPVEAAEQPREQAQREQSPERVNPKDEVANNPTTPNGPAQAMAGLAGMAGTMATGSPAVAAALSGLAAAATNVVQERSAQPKVFEYAGSDHANKSAQAIGNGQSNGRDVGGLA